MGCWESACCGTHVWNVTANSPVRHETSETHANDRIENRLRLKPESQVPGDVKGGEKTWIWEEILATSAVILWHKALDLKQSYQHVQKKQENDLTENLKTTFVLPLSHSLPWHSVGRCDCWLGVAEILQIMHSHLGVQKNTSELVTQKTKRHKCNTSAQLKNRMRLSHHTPAMHSWRVSTYKSVSKTLAKRELRLSNFRPPRN